MNRMHSHLSEIDMIGKLADLKDDHYKNTLIVSAVMELLIEKKVLTREEIAVKAEQLNTSILDLNRPIP